MFLILCHCSGFLYLLNFSFQAVLAIALLFQELYSLETTFCFSFSEDLPLDELPTHLSLNIAAFYYRNILVIFVSDDGFGLVIQVVICDVPGLLIF